MQPEAFPAGGRVAVLGAGVVGLTCAIELATAGFQVDLLDRAEPGAATSCGTAGIILASHIEPLTNWNLVKSLPLLLLRKDSEIILRKDYLRQLKPWLTGYAKALRPTRVEQSKTALAAMNRKAWAAWVGLGERAGLGNKLRQSGVLVGYTKAAAWEAAAESWHVKKQEFGIDWDLVSARDLGDMVPGLGNSLNVAVLVKGDGMVSDPQAVLAVLAEHAVAVGVRVVCAEVRAVALAAGQGVEVTTATGTDEYAGAVLACGAWSGSVAASLGDKVPLEVQRGYNHTYPAAAVKLYYPVIVEDRGLAITPLSCGLRFGGWVEFGGTELPPDQRIFKRLLRVAGEMLPHLQQEGATEWMGHRPTLPDSVPVLGPGTKQARVLYAFGHGHLGFTQAAVTAQCITALASGTMPPFPLEGFSPGRFAAT